jgi:hypothetical protein
MLRVAARVWRRVGMCLAFVPQGKPRPAVCVTTCNVNITPSGQQAYLREPSTQNSVAAKFITQLPQIPLQPALRGLSFARALHAYASACTPACPPHLHAFKALRSSHLVAGFGRDKGKTLDNRYQTRG